MDRGKKKLINTGAKGQKRIIADNYGSNDGFTRELGFASYENQEGFRLRLPSLQHLWEDLAPSFHDWVQRIRGSQFIDCVIDFTRKDSGVDRLFYNNSID